MNTQKIDTRLYTNYISFLWCKHLFASIYLFAITGACVWAGMGSGIAKGFVAALWVAFFLITGVQWHRIKEDRWDRWVASQCAIIDSKTGFDWEAVDALDRDMAKVHNDWITDK